MVKKICDPLTGLQKESGPLWIGEKCGPRKNLAPMHAGCKLCVLPYECSERRRL